MNFQNTEIAFSYKNNKQLRKAYFLFKLIGSNTLVKIGKTLSNVAIKTHIPINWAVKPTIYSHFCGGETIEESIPIIRQLEKYNVKAILDYSVEGGDDEKTITAALNETLRTITNAASDKNIPFTVFKPTAFGKSEVLEKVNFGKPLTETEKNEFIKFKERIETLCRTAYENNVAIMIDAEDYCYQNTFDAVVTEMSEKYNKEKAIVYNTLQMYRCDRMNFLKLAYEKAVKGNYFLGIKFVRGAYMERERRRALAGGYPSPIHSNKEATDNAYNEALNFSIEHIDRISIFNGTHNEYSSQYLTELMKQHNIKPDDNRIWFSQLYGMSDHITFNLANAGYNAAKYVPYGPVKHVLPYLIRRTEENTSVAGQTSRELLLLKQEIERRKNKK